MNDDIDVKDKKDTSETPDTSDTAKKETSGQPPVPEVQSINDREDSEAKTVEDDTDASKQDKVDSEAKTVEDDTDASKQDKVDPNRENEEGDTDAPKQDEVDPNGGNAKGVEAPDAGKAPEDAAAAQRAADIERLRAALADAEKDAAAAKAAAKKTKAEAKEAKDKQKEAEKKMEELRKPANAAAKAASAAAAESAKAQEVARGEAVLNAKEAEKRANEVADLNKREANTEAEAATERAKAARARANAARKEAEAAEEARANAGEEARANAEEEARIKAEAAEEAEAAAAEAEEEAKAAVEKAKKVEREETINVSIAKGVTEGAILELEAAIAAVPAAVEAAETTAATAHETQNSVATEAEAAANAEKTHNEAPTAVPAANKKAKEAKEKVKKIKEELKKAQKGDAYNVDFLDMVVEAGGGGADQKDRPDADRTFDTLGDLKNLAQEANKVEQDNLQEDPKNSELKKLRQDVMRLRKGNLYKAVIMSKDPKAAYDQEQKQRGRFERFNNDFKNSKVYEVGSKVGKVGGEILDVNGNILNASNAISGIVGSADKDYKNSRAFKILDIVNNARILLGSIRKIIAEIKNFVHHKYPTVEKKMFGLLSIITNAATILAKSAAIGKYVADKFNNKTASDKLEKIKNWATLGSQLGGITGGVYSLKNLLAKRSQLKKDQKNEKTEVEKILDNIEKNNGDNEEGDKKGLEEGDKKGSEEEEEVGSEEEEDEEGLEEENEEELEEEDKKGLEEKDKKESEKEGKKESKKKDKKNKAKKIKMKQLEKEADKKWKKRVEKVRGTAWDTNPNLNDEDKELLASYFARERVLSKNKKALIDTSAGLIANVLGVGSTASAIADDNVAENDPEKDKSTMKKKIFGGIANGFIAANSTRLAAEGGISLAERKQDNAEKEQIKNSLWGAVQSLQGDEYGLKKIAANLAYNADKPPEDDDITEANNAVTRYNTVAKQVEVSVDYSKLFIANDVEKFKDALVAGI